MMLTHFLIDFFVIQDWLSQEALDSLMLAYNFLLPTTFVSHSHTQFACAFMSWEVSMIAHLLIVLAVYKLHLFLRLWNIHYLFQI